MNFISSIRNKKRHLYTTFGAYGTYRTHRTSGAHGTFGTNLTKHYHE